MLRKLCCLVAALALSGAPAGASAHGVARASTRRREHGHHRARHHVHVRHPHRHHRHRRHGSAGRNAQATSTVGLGGASGQSLPGDAMVNPNLVVPDGPGLQEFPITIRAPTYYVSPTGQNSAPGTGADPTSLSHALKIAPANSVIQVEPGIYPYIRDTQVHPGWVTITGRGDPTPPVFGGALLAGAQNVRIVDVDFAGTVQIRDSIYWQVGWHQPAENIQILNSEINCGSTTTYPATNGIFMRGLSQNILISGDYVHNCVVGFGSVAQDTPSSNVQITHDLFQDFPGDAMDVGAMNGLVIDHDVIRDIADPNGAYHDDGIQFFGNTSNVQITNNVIANSRDQLIFIQDAAGPGNRPAPNQNILIEGNLVYGGGAWPEQDQGGQNVDWIDNTLEYGHYGTLLLRQSGYTGLKPTGLVEGNIIGDTNGVGDTNGGVTERDNLFPEATRQPADPSPGDLYGVSAGYTDAGAGDFTPTAATPTYTTTSASAASAPGSGASTTDLFGTSVPQRPAYGALQPGDPGSWFGAPRYGPAPLS